MTMRMSGDPPIPREQLEEFLKTSSEPFGSFLGPDGDPWLLERSMVEWFLNDLPQPSQASLDEVTRPATRVRLIEGGCQAQPLGKKVVMEITQPAQIAEFSRLLQLVPDEPRWHCMCRGDYAVEFRHGDGSLHYVGFHHGHSLRRDEVWGGDASLASPRPVLEWLAAQGLRKPLDSFCADERQAQESQKQFEAWLAAGPECLREPISDWLKAGQNKQALAGVYEAAALQPAAELVPKLVEWCTYQLDRRGPIPEHVALPAWVLDKMQPAEVMGALPGLLNDKQTMGLALLLFQPTRLPLLLETPSNLKFQLLKLAPKEGAYLFGDQLPRDYRLLIDSAPPALAPLLPDVWENPRADHAQRFFGDTAKAQSIRDLLAWTACFPTRSFDAFGALLTRVDSLLVSVPLEELKPILLTCARDPALLPAVTRHLAEAPGYPNDAFADFPKPLKAELIQLAQSLRPQMVPSLTKRLAYSQNGKVLLEVLKAALAVGALWWLYHH